MEISTIQILSAMLIALLPATLALKLGKELNK